MYFCNFWKKHDYIYMFKKLNFLHVENFDQYGVHGQLLKVFYKTITNLRIILSYT